MSKAASNGRMWNLIKDYNKGTVGFYRYDIPYCIFSLEEWCYMLSHPIIKGTEPDVNKEDAPSSNDCGLPSDCAS